MCVRTTRLLLTALLGGAISVCAIQPVAGQPSATPDEDRLLLGTWVLNLAKSTYRSGPAPRSQIRTYEPHEQGVKATIKSTFIDGRTATVGYVANYDSLEYSVTGSPDVDTIALKRVAPRTAQATLSHAGKVIATARRVISEDGNTLTISYQGLQMGNRVDYTAVFEKQK